MPEQKTVSKDIKVKIFGPRIAFVDALFEAKAFKAGDKKRFSTKFLVPKTGDAVKLAFWNEDLKKYGPLMPAGEGLLLALTKAAEIEFKDAAVKELKIMRAENKLCLTDGDIKDYDGYEGNYVLSASNKTRPTILGANKEPLTEKDGKIYSGCFVNGIVSLWAQNNDWGKRINCNLQGVQFVADGEAFSGGGVASVEEFDDVEGGTTLPADNSSFM